MPHNHWKVKHKMHRTSSQRWHLLRTLVTQLIEHERIRTTITKCKKLWPLAEKVMILGKKASEVPGNVHNNMPRIRLEGIVTTKLAQQKLVKQIMPRFKD